jgi:hypothetical protein
MIVVFASVIATSFVVARWQAGDAARSTGALTANASQGQSAADRFLGPGGGIPLFSDGFIDDSGYEHAMQFADLGGDRASLDVVRAEQQGRARRGIAGLQAQIDGRRPGSADRGQLEMIVGLLNASRGEFEEAVRRFDVAARTPGLPAALRANLIALRGVASLRRGEVENCVACAGTSSCLFPILPEAVHQRQAGSRAAVRDFTEYLQARPDDFGVRWLLNIAYMTLGEYPDKVPSEYLVPLERFRSTLDPGQFSNAAIPAGIGVRGQNMFGGSIFDDFTGDGRPDVFVCSADCGLGASLFVNRGDGVFEERRASAGLDNQDMAINAKHADFDNDGDLDIVMLRGGWEYPCRLTLLRNDGEQFSDVTVASGLARPIASEVAAWGDYDNDGFVDLFVGGEVRPNGFESLNHCRLYHNERNGTFVDVAAQAGVENDRWTKGATWGDYDSDGFIDLYVANRGSANRLYHNNGDGTFADRAPALGVTEPAAAFSCWFWDYDNDGRLDLFVTAFSATLNDYVRDVLGKPTTAERPRLYRNLGPDGFRDVTKEAGLDRVWMPMGSNFGDIDNDGFLDVYLGTGLTSFSSLVPNVMLKNVDGRRFEDVTLATRTGHLQKGHGVSFADSDADGDLDLFVETGGSVPGDLAHNALFQNPGQGRHWLSIKLVGTKTNRAAIGASVRVDFRDANNRLRSVHRVVDSGSSFGGNSLVVHVGLGEARHAESISVRWPVGGAVQTLHNIAADQSIEIVERTAAASRP